MQLLNIYKNKFFGIKLLRLFNIQIEFWFAKPNSYVPWHIHNNISSTIVHLWGKSTFKTPNRRCDFKRFTFFKWGLIAKGEQHNVATHNQFAAFLNIEYWHTSEITSAVEDFTYVKHNRDSRIEPALS